LSNWEPLGERVQARGTTMTATELTSTKQAILQQLSQSGQATAHQLARALEISVQAARRHLKELEADALVTYQAIRTGMGRPQHHYQLTACGRDRLPSRYSDFAVSFLDALAETAGEEQMRTALRQQWQRKAADYRERIGSGPLPERLAQLAQLRRAEGYMAEWYPAQADDEEAPAYVFAENNCAIAEVATAYPAVCGHELEMFAALLPDCTVERIQWLHDGEHRCGYAIRPKQGAAARAS
jgi:DeoR family suf operon transcriptional repressor